ncbi:MAG: insulinase family protein [Polyangiaceae bacterium]|nr:insulinase family protein [Polyangiaceae bacterium]
MKLFVETSAKLPIVSIAIAFRSGSTFDPSGREGLCRTTARMLRRGCEGWNADAIEARIDTLGGEFGADASPGATTAHAEVISRRLEPFLEICTNLIGAPTFPEDELGRLLREAKAELIEARDSDRTLAARAFRRTLFDNHPYGRRVAGTLPSLEAIGRADIEAFYKRHFTKENALVAISGDVTEKGAQEIAERLLSKLPEGERFTDAVPEPSPKGGRRLVIVDKPERTQTQMVIGWLGTHGHDADHIAWLVGNTAFGGTFTSRLMQEVRAKRGWSYGASSRVGFERHRDAFTMWTAPSSTDAPACMQLEVELLQTLRQDGLTEEELDFTKKYLARSHAFEVDTPRKRVHQPLEEALYDLPPGYHAKYLERVAAVTRDEVNEGLRRRMPFDDLLVAVVATNDDTGEALSKALPGVEVTVAPYDLE